VLSGVIGCSSTSSHEIVNPSNDETFPVVPVSHQ
jgi:hypothetical protein